MAVRRIPKSYGKNLTGAFAATKGLPPQEFESRLELDLLCLLAADPRVERFETQPVHVPMGVNERPYTPDVLVHFHQDPFFGHLLCPQLIEVKPHQNLIDDAESLNPKFEAAKAFAADPERGWDFLVLTERQIPTPFVRNARLLLANLNVTPRPELVAEILDEVRARQECEFMDLVDPRVPEMARLERISAIWWLIGMRNVWTDLSKRFVRQRKRPQVIIRWVEPGTPPDPAFCWSVDGPPMAATYYDSLVPNPARQVSDLFAPHQGILDLSIGSRVACGDKVVVIKEYCDDLAHMIVHEERTRRTDKVPIAMFRPLPVPKAHECKRIDLATVSDDRTQIMTTRSAGVRPLLKGKFTQGEMQAKADSLGVTVSTLYRWRQRFNASGQIPFALMPVTSNGGKGKPRLGDREQVLTEFIDQHYLKKDPRLSVTQVWDLMNDACIERGIATPCLNTLRARIAGWDPYQVLLAREGYAIAREKTHMETGKSPLVDYPLAVVEIDLNYADITVLDDETREVLGRPTITHAVDAYSSAVMGISYDLENKGSWAVGACIYQAVMPKEDLLKKLGIDAEWPCWGLPTAIHLDNAREYRGNMTRSTCATYKISLYYRPVRVAWYGGHVESFHEVLSTALHGLPGTNFGSVKERGDYKPHESAVMTKSEFEQWLYGFIVGYNSKPKKDGCSPAYKFQEGLNGSQWVQPRGALSKPADTARFRIDFLPIAETTIQAYGVDIEGIRYQNANVLREFMFDTDPESPLKSQRKQFTFRRDPNDISVVYFWNPKIQQYVDIPAIDEEDLVGVTLAEAKAQRLARKRAGEANPLNGQVGLLARKGRELVQAAGVRTKAARKALAKQLQHLTDAKKHSHEIRGMVPQVAPEPTPSIPIIPLRIRVRRDAILETEETS